MYVCKILVALHKKIEMIFTGLGFNGIAKMQRYLYLVIDYDYSIAQHIFQKVLGALQDAGFTLRCSKCAFGKGIITIWASSKA